MLFINVCFTNKKKKNSHHLYALRNNLLLSVDDLSFKFKIVAKLNTRSWDYTQKI